MAIPGHFVGAVLASVAEKGLEMLFKELSKKEKEKAWAQESLFKNKDQQTSHRVESLEKQFQEHLESVKHELKDLRAELQNKQGKKEEDVVSALESLLKNKDQQISHRFESLEKRFQEGLDTIRQKDQQTSHRVESLEKQFQEHLGTIKHEIKDLRTELQNKQGNKEQDIALALESFLKKNDQENSHRVESLKEQFQERLETIKHELKDLRAELLMNQGKREEDLVSALESLLRKKDVQISQRFESLEKGFQEGLETIKHELKDVRAELQNNQGKKERDISWAQKSMLKNKDQQLSHRFETSEKDLQEVLESIKHELKDLRAELKKKKGVEEDNKSLALIGRFKNSMHQLSRGIETLDEDFLEGLETIINGLPVLRD